MGLVVCRRLTLNITMHISSGQWRSSSAVKTEGVVAILSKEIKNSGLTSFWLTLPVYIHPL